MIHILTMRHLDPSAVSLRQAIVLRPLEMGIVNRLLQELGGTDEQRTSDARRRASGDQGRHGRLPLVGRRPLQPHRRRVRPPAPEGDGMRAGRPRALPDHRAGAIAGSEWARNCHPANEREVGTLPHRMIPKMPSLSPPPGHPAPSHLAALVMHHFRLEQPGNKHLQVAGWERELDYWQQCEEGQRLCPIFRDDSCIIPSGRT